ncbi:MAG: hypothetical protein R3217_10260 [Gammaproteobacteria bacterium]|nr:hypothetical protein [Gammaproteobacteria bacterium]
MHVFGKQQPPRPPGPPLDEPAKPALSSTLDQPQELVAEIQRLLQTIETITVRKLQQDAACSAEDSQEISMLFDIAHRHLHRLNNKLD